MDEQAGSNVVSVGVDLTEFYMSVEWDILEVPAVRYSFNIILCSRYLIDRHTPGYPGEGYLLRWFQIAI